MNDRDLKISEKEFDRQSRQTAWIVTLVFHLCALLPMIFITCSPTAPPDDLTQIVGWGGSGGNPNVDAPVGPAPKGDPNAKGSSRSTPQPQEQQTTTPVNPATATPTTRDPNTKATQEITKPNQTTSPTTNTQAQQSSTTTTTPQNTDNSGQATGNPNGVGTKPAGGSGGSTVGVGDPGIGRCWSTSPSQAARGGKTNEEGEVMVAAIVKWDGTVTSIRKVSGSTTLYNKAASLLRNAKACRAEPGAPDVPITLRYKFKLD